MSSLNRLACLRRLILQGKCVNQAAPKRCMGEIKKGIQYRGELADHGSSWWAFSEAITGCLFFYMAIQTYRHTSHLFGGDKPDIHPELWTDEELGIPPDEEDIYPPGYTPMQHRV